MSGKLVGYAIDVPKIDAVATLGLSGVNNSLSYRVAEIETHFHSAQQVYGLALNTMTRKSVTPIVVVAGNGAWGTEIELHNGTVIEAGSSTKKFDCNHLWASNVSDINRVTILEFYSYVVGATVACSFTDAGDTVGKVGHGLAAGTKIKFETIVLTTGIVTHQIYYVVAAPGADTFQVELAPGSGAIVLVTNGTGTYYSLGPAGSLQTLVTELVLFRTAMTTESMTQIMQMPRITCNSRLSCRGVGAGSNSVSFFLGLHTYPA